MNTNNLKIAVFVFLFTSITVFAQREPKPRDKKQYTIEQATSERAQLHTVAFSGLAFMTGNFGADTFFPPGKVADFFGFQYMRDNDKNEKGHNTDFLTSIANSVYSVLTTSEIEELKLLAKQQAPVYDAFALKRYELIRAFRDYMEKGKEPELAFIKKTGAELYTMDAELSYGRAIVVGKIIQSFTAEQKASLAKFQFDNSSTWLNISEQLDKRSLSHRENVCVMTYLSELFSWYAGSVEADVYFCPERHGTYFGGFYMKDFPAMGNPDYYISTALTGDSGRDFMASLTSAQAEFVYTSMKEQRPLLQQIVEIRKTVALELRKAITGQTPDKNLVYSSVKKYGELDAEISLSMAKAFAQIYKTLTAEQKKQLVSIRNQSVLPKGVYLYSDTTD
jgi:hypothetical protein